MPSDPDVTDDAAEAPPSTLRALPAAVWGLGFVSLFADMASDMVYPLLPGLLGSLGAGALALGMVEGVAELCAGFLRVWAGRATDRGRSPGVLVVVGYLIAAIARSSSAFATQPLHVLLARSTDRFGKGLRSAPRDAILSVLVRPANRALAFGVHRAMDNLGAVLGGLCAFVALGPLDLTVQQTIAWSIVPGLLSVVVAIAALRRAKDVTVTAKPEGAKDDASVAMPPAVKRFLVVTSIFVLGASADAFLLARLDALGLEAELLPIAWISLQLGKSLFNVPGGWLADRLGSRRVLAASMFVYALVYAGFAFANDIASMWLLFAPYAAYYGLAEGAEKAVLVELAPSAARGRALGWLHAVHGVVLLPANLGFGWVFSRSPSTAFAICAVCATISGVMMVVALFGVNADKPAPP